MCFDYDEYCEFSVVTLVKTRKAHVCCACSRKIGVGELAQSHSGKFDGNMFSDHLCGECHLTIYRIHFHELEEGCRDWESWCAPHDLFDYCHEAPFERSTFEEGQQFLAWEMRNRKQLKADKKLAIAK